MIALAGSPVTSSGAYVIRAEGIVERSIRPVCACGEIHEPTYTYEGLCSTCLDFEGSAFETHGRVAYGGEA